MIQGSHSIMEQIIYKIYKGNLQINEKKNLLLYYQVDLLFL